MKRNGNLVMEIPDRSTTASFSSELSVPDSGPTLLRKTVPEKAGERRLVVLAQTLSSNLDMDPLDAMGEGEVDLAIVNNGMYMTETNMAPHSMLVSGRLTTNSLTSISTPNGPTNSL